MFVLFKIFEDWGIKWNGFGENGDLIIVIIFDLYNLG